MAKTCFVISPIGNVGSETRKHADRVFSFIIEPALRARGIAPVRSDQIEQAGRISDQMFRAILGHDLCIAVLTGANPNVYYELAVAQSAGRPVILLIEEGGVLPFDVQDLRVLTYDLHLESYDARTHIQRLEAFVDSIEQSGWCGIDLFRPYRGDGSELTMPDVASLGVRIRSPESGAEVDMVDVEGTFERLPPAGYELRSLRYYPKEHGFVPHGTIAIDRGTKRWKIAGFDFGGVPGDARGIEVAVAGSDARILLDYWIQARDVHREVMRLLRENAGEYFSAKWLPPIRAWPTDLLTCARVEVTKKRHV
jgi:hypothetical protein